MIRMALIVIVCLVGLAVAGLAAAIAFGTSKPPPYLASIGEPFRHVDFSDLPPVQTTPVRDGLPLAFRAWPAAAAPTEAERVVIAIHGSSAHAASLHVLAKALQAENITVYAPDIRGHGSSGPHGDISHAGQLDEDAADFVAMVRAKHPNARLILPGHHSARPLRAPC
jgi:predicted alpha/beta-fold hydrolase